MDTSESYIKMCEKATEIQKLERVIPDRVFKVCETYPYQIWLPRQDQLQEMLDTDIFKILDRFISWIGNWDCEINDYCVLNGFRLEIEEYKSMEQLWLAFVMKEKYNKVWNGKDWEVIK